MSQNCFPFTPFIIKLHTKTPNESRVFPMDFGVKRSRSQCINNWKWFLVHFTAIVNSSWNFTHRLALSSARALLILVSKGHGHNALIPENDFWRIIIYLPPTKLGGGRYTGFIMAVCWWKSGFRTITTFPFDIPWYSTHVHVLPMTEGRPLLIFGSKGQGQICTLKFTSFPHDTITLLPFDLQWWYFRHELIMTRGPLLILGPKGQGQIFVPLGQPHSS